MTARVVYLTIRDPDWETVHVTDVTGDVTVEEIDVDLGSSFNGPKGFWSDLGDDGGEQWIRHTRASVAHLPADSDVRTAVEEICTDLETRR